MSSRIKHIDHIDPIHSQKRPTLHTVTNSPFGLKVHCFLTHKGIPFENIYGKASNISKQIPVGKQVPVLTVGGVSKNDSTPIGIWLDELYPDRPRLLPEEETLRQRLLDIDDWVTKQLISLRFRASRFIDSGEPWSAIRRGWILGELLNHTAPGGIDYLKKFLSERYMIEARRKSGMCAKCQRSLAKAVKKARHLALLPFSPSQKGALPVHYRPRS